MSAFTRQRIGAGCFRGTRIKNNNRAALSRRRHLRPPSLSTRQFAAAARTYSVSRTVGARVTSANLRCDPCNYQRRRRPGIQLTTGLNGLCGQSNIVRKATQQTQCAYGRFPRNPLRGRRNCKTGAVHPSCSGYNVRRQW